MKTAQSAIRLRFVPDLVDRLICGGISAWQKCMADLGKAMEMRTGESLAIQHLVGKSDSKSILSREQKLNQRESAIRR